jgi:hypothetical protein
LVSYALLCADLRFDEGKNITSLKKNETIALWVENEVVKKASTLTANGDPHLSGRSLFRGLAFLSTVPKKG